MGSFQKVAMAVILVAGITTFLLPGRQTASLFQGGTKLVTGTLSTAQGTSQGAVG